MTELETFEGTIKITFTARDVYSARIALRAMGAAVMTHPRTEGITVLIAHRADLLPDIPDEGLRSIEYEIL